MSGAPEPVGERVRRRLRELRAEQGLTLKQVSEQAHIDISTLSRLESGKRRLASTTSRHWRLPSGSAPTTCSAGRRTGPASAQPPATHDDLTMWPLTNHVPRGWAARVQDPHQRRARRKPPDTLRVHDGHDWMYVLDGRMRLLLGEQDLVIEPGEAVEFSTWTPHWFGAIDGPVESIAVLGPHGERAHLHG